MYTTSLHKRPASRKQDPPHSMSIPHALTKPYPSKMMLAMRPSMTGGEGGEGFCLGGVLPSRHVCRRKRRMSYMSLRLSSVIPVLQRGDGVDDSRGTHRSHSPKAFDMPIPRPISVSRVIFLEIKSAAMPSG